MRDRHDLAGALSRSTEWVRSEIAFIDDLAAGLGCRRAVEGGPGIAYRIGGRAIGHAHPKRNHIGIGLPDRMRTDVAELTDALRAQRQLAWFNYAPDIADRDTVALLFQISLDSELGSRSQPADATPVGPGQNSDDEADLLLILTVLRAFKEHERSTGRPSTLKPLRETVFFRWEGPRLPKGRTRSPLLPHSPAARTQRATDGIKNLIYEHVTPLATVLRQLLENMPTNTKTLHQVLDSTSDRVIITADEDRALTKAGNRDSAPDSDDPWSRYRALSLTKADFAPYASDIR